MQDDSTLDDLYQELLSKAKANEAVTQSTLKSELGQSFVSDLVKNSDKDISLAEYLKLGEKKDDSIQANNHLISLLDDLEKGTTMNEDILEEIEDELDDIDISSVRYKQRDDMEKNLFINHKKRIRQSSTSRINPYANTQSKISEETELRPLSLKRYNSK